jgi:DNA repair protein RadA/Sms
VPGVEAALDEAKPSLLIVDSVQSLARPDVPGVPGSVAQVRACADALIRAAKASGTTLVLVGQATKDGQVAGPRTLEHLVDAVLWFEGEPDGTLRMLRATKNRFGPAHEIGCFAMTGTGLAELADPSTLLVSTRECPVPGVAVAPVLAGNRPLLVEVQALVGPTSVTTPRRSAAGLDAQRLGLLVAVLERRGRVRLGAHDVFAAAMRGVRAVEPAADLAIALAVASSFYDAPLPASCVAFGEVGLSGEVRVAGDIDRRLSEAARLGFSTAIVPKEATTVQIPGMNVTGVADVSAALAHLDRAKPRAATSANLR